MSIKRIYNNISSEPITYDDKCNKVVLALPKENIIVNENEVTRENGDKLILPSLSILSQNSKWLKLLRNYQEDDSESNSESISSSRVDHPTYYQNNASGIECIDVIEDFDFCTGNAIKYLWRCGRKKETGMNDTNKQIEDLEKAVWYINRKLKKLRGNDRNSN